MKKLIALIAGGAICLAAAGAAEAKAPAAGSFGLYGFYIPTDESYVIPLGRLSSSKGCVGNRKFDVMAVHKGSKPKLIDKGVSSADGGISADIEERETVGADDAVLTVAGTKKCAKVKFSFRKLRREVAEQQVARAINTNVKFLTFAANARRDGMFAGSVGSSSRKCSANRKIKLLLGDKVIDSGRTTADGTWALHFTEPEWLTPGWMRAVVDKTSKCAGEKTKFNMSELG